jgi:multidrug efflux pump subunit AcrB
VISLFGFIVILGIVVDDAIVTGENIYRHLRTGENSLDAVIQGTREVAVPVTFGVLTTVAAFLPIAFIDGHRGQLFAAIPVVVIPILLFSLIESKLILPAHLRHLTIQRNGDLSPIERWQQGFATGFENLVMRHYRPALEWVLRYRYPVLGLFVGVLLLSTAMLSSGWMKFVFFPKVQSEFANATLEMPVGTPFDITDRQVQRIVEAAQRLQREYRERTGEAVIVNILSSTGGAGSHLGNVTFEITPPEERLSDVSSAQLVNQWRDLIGPVPGAENLTYRAEIGRVSDPVDIQLSGPDFASLSRVADQIKARLADYPSVFDISDSFSDGKEALELVLKPEAQLLGLSREQILSQVRQGFFGYEVQRIQRGRDDVRVMVRYAEADRQSLRSLEEALIERPDGGRVPLSALVDLVPDSSPAQITRIDLQRTINVRADIDKQATNMLVLQRELSAYIDGLLQNHPDIRYTLEGEAREQRESFASLKWGLAVVLFVIYCLLAIPFGSYSQPFIVLTIIPFGAIGALAGHWIMGMDLTLISLLGLLALVGVVVNDSLVLVDFVNQRRAEHLPLAQVIREAAAQRFRPVVLTSLTTFFGLMPLLFEQSTQAQFLIPMAVSLGFGILFATVITLFLVPVNYMVLEDIRRLWAWLMQKPVSPEPETEQP